MSQNSRVMGSIDRLSALPDSLLVHILSFVNLDSDINVRDAARTSVLSKRWRYLWCELTTLRFINRNGGNIEETSKFVDMVHMILLSSTAKSLEEFSVSFIPYNFAWAFDVDIWVDLALKLKSKIVQLSLPRPPGDLIQYCPKEKLYSNSVMTELSLEFCKVAPKRGVNWKSLTKLRMVDVELHQHVVENILSGCPVMCGWELHGCWGFNSFKIDSPHLRKLSVVEDVEKTSFITLEISAPYLSILEIKFRPYGRKVWLKNISAMVEVEVDFVSGFYHTEEIPADMINSVMELFKQIQHIKKLYMNTHVFQYISKMVADGWQLLQQSRLLSLKIDNPFLFDDIKSGILSMLESCPKLETLQLHEYTKMKPPPRPPLSMIDDLNCNLLHLKMVGIKISVGINKISVESSPMLMLVRILLGRAVALEKMEIQFEIKNPDEKIEDREEFDKVVDEVLSWPKSSQALVITSLVDSRK